MDCENLFIFFKNLKDHLPLNLHGNLDEYQKKLVAFMSHHARKIYLNAQLPTTLSQLNSDETVIIVDYKMRINPKKQEKEKMYGLVNAAGLYILFYYILEINIPTILTSMLLITGVEILSKMLGLQHLLYTE